MNLKPYPEYKDSGVAWLGEVPKHWEMRKFRTILTPIAERNRPDLPLLSVVREKGVIERNIKDDSENHNYIPDDLSNYKVVKSGQFAMNKMKAWQGSYGISKFNGIVSPAYFVFDLKCIEPDFFHKAVRSRAYVPFFTQASDGVRVGQWDLSQTRMKEMQFFIPSSEEQLAIARFLDYKTAQIARFTKAKKRMIELLKEQKQVIINDAVTGKIDVTTGKPYPKYKDSGVEWLGQVPEGWEVLPLKRIAQFKGGSGFPHSFQGMKELEIPFIKVSDMTLKGNETYIIDTVNSITKESASELGARIFPKNTIIFPKVGGAMLTNKRRITAKASCIDNNIMGCILNVDTFFDFIFLIFQQIDLGLLSKPGPVPAISEGEVSEISIPLPSMHEITEILPYVYSKTTAIDLTISRTEREIALMQEYRTRLISDVVTGKIDVRDIKIPDITVIHDTIDEPIDDLEGEEELETEEAEE